MKSNTCTVENQLALLIEMLLLGILLRFCITLFWKKNPNIYRNEINKNLIETDILECSYDSVKMFGMWNTPVIL